MASVADTLFGPGKVIKRPILLDEVNFPLKKVFSSMHPGEIIRGDSTSFFTLFKALKDEEVAKARSNASYKNYLEDVEFKGFNYNRGAPLTRDRFCNKTVDIRDYFRVFADLERITKDPKEYAVLTPVVNSIVTYPGEYCKRDCATGSYNASCENYLKIAYNTLINNPGENIIKNVAYYPKRSTFDALGNVIVSPPTRKNPYGCIIYGNSKVPSTLEPYTWSPGCDSVGNNNICTKEFTVNFKNLPGKGSNTLDQYNISPELDAIFQKFTLQPKVGVYTGWLEVGHIDEIVSFIPFQPLNAADPGFRMLIASPGKFIEMWESKKSEEGCLFTKSFETIGRVVSDTYEDGLIGSKFHAAEWGSFSPGFQGVGLDGCNIQKADFDNPRMKPLIDFNKFLQTNIINLIKTRLCDAIGIDESLVIDIPILYTGPDELFNVAALKFDIASYGDKFTELMRNKTLEQFGSKYPELLELNEGLYPKIQEDPKYQDIMIFLAPYIMNIAFENFGAVHLSDCFINSLYSTEFIIGPEIHTNIGIKEYIENEIITEGQKIKKIYYLSDWDWVKYQHGGIHCFTSELRDFSRAPEVFARFAGAANAVRPANAGSNFGLTGLFGNSGGARRRNTRRARRSTHRRNRRNIHTTRKGRRMNTRRRRH